MSDPTRIRIDRLAVRVRGVPVETARAAADGLGSDLAGRLAQAGLTPGAVGDLRLGSLALPPGPTPAQVRAAVAGGAAAAVARRARGEAT